MTSRNPFGRKPDSGHSTVIEDYLAGDPETVSDVMGWVSRSLSRYRHRLPQDIEDLHQDVLVALTRDLKEGKFRGEASLETLCRVYVDHKCIDRLRYLGRRQFVDLETLSLLDKNSSALDRVINGQRHELALTVMREMSEECLSLWRMILKGLDYRKMSELSGVAAGTLRVRVLRCRQRARDLLSRLERGES